MIAISSEPVQSRRKAYFTIGGIVATLILCLFLFPARPAFAVDLGEANTPTIGYEDNNVLRCGSFASGVTGNTTTVHYLTADNAHNMTIALYSTGGGSVFGSTQSPLTLLNIATYSGLLTNAWHTETYPATPVTSGTNYWICEHGDDGGWINTSAGTSTNDQNVYKYGPTHGQGANPTFDNPWVSDWTDFAPRYVPAVYFDVEVPPTPTPTPTPVQTINYSGQNATNSAQYIVVSGGTLSGGTIPFTMWRRPIGDDDSDPCSTSITHDCHYDMFASIGNNNPDFNVVGYHFWLGDSSITQYIGALHSINIQPNGFIKGINLGYLSGQWDGTVTWGRRWNYNGSPDNPVPDPWFSQYPDREVLFTLQNITTGDLATESGQLYEAGRLPYGSEATVDPLSIASPSGTLAGTVEAVCGKIPLGLFDIPDFFCEAKQWFLGTFSINQTYIDNRTAAMGTFIAGRSPFGYATALTTLDIGGAMEASHSAIPDFDINIPLITVPNSTVNPAYNHLTLHVAGTTIATATGDFIGKWRDVFKYYMWAMTILFIAGSVYEILGFHSTL